MARTTKALSGAAKDKALRGLAESAASVPADVARRIGDVLAGHISEVRIRRDTWDAMKTARAQIPQATLTARAVPASSPAPTAPTAPVAAPLPAVTLFDPFAFSAVAVLTRKGKAALIAELDKIASATQLRELATAQHLAIDPALTAPSAIRAAVVAATERRIAERKAAAS